MNETHYPIVTKCSNCGHVPQKMCSSAMLHGQMSSAPIKVPKGTIALDFVKELICGNCGCKGVLVPKV
jgi:hypothetical protein